VNRYSHERAISEHFGTIARLADHDRTAKHTACRGDTQRQYDGRFDEGHFTIQPPTAGFDLTRARALMYAAFAPLLELEVFYCIGDENLVARNGRLLQGASQEAAGRPDKRLAGEVLTIAGLLAHEHQPGAERALTGDHLRCTLIKVAAPA
jgi:hypothetical protein